MANIKKFKPVVMWNQVLGLTVVQGAVTFAWVIYRLYLPSFLAEFSWSPQFAAGLLLVESAIAIDMEPLMGNLSDRNQRWMGKGLPLISVGVIIAVTLFITIPALAIFGNPLGVLYWVVIAILVTWSVAMTVFHIPAISLLKRYSSIKYLLSPSSF